MADRVLRIRFVGDTGDVDKAVSHISTKMGVISGAVGALTSGLMSGAAGFASQFFGSMITGASDLQETMNKSRVVFGQNMGAMEQWASSAVQSLGMTKQQALENASSFANMFQQLGFTGDAAAKMSQSVVQMSTDFASFHNLPVEEVNTAIAASFRGEYDALQKMVPTINAAAVEQQALTETGKKSAKELTQQEKAQATLNLVMQGGASAAGDFARSNGSYATESKKATAQIQEFATQIGSFLLPILASLLAFITSTVIPGLQSLGNFISQNIDFIKVIGAIIGGILIPALIAWGVQSTIAAAKSVAAWFAAQMSAIQSAASQAGAALSTVGGWIAMGARAVATAAVVVASWVVMGIQSLLNAARMAAAWLIAMGPVGWIIAAVIALVALIIANWETIKTWTINIWNSIWQFIEGIWNFIKDSIAAAIQGIIEHFRPFVMFILQQWENIKTTTQIVWNIIWSVINTVINAIGAVINWVWVNIIQPVFNFISLGIYSLQLTFQLIGAAIGLVWTKLGEGINWVWVNVIQKVFDGIRGGIDTLRGWFDQGVKFIGDIWNRLKELSAGPIRWIITSVWNDGLRNAWNTISKLWGAQPLDPIPLNFARGGSVHGPGTGISDSIPAFLSSGEHVWTAREVRNAGGHSVMERLRNMANEGMLRFAYGGVVPTVAAAGDEITRLFGRMPGGIGGVGSRSGPSDHPTGHALDFMTLNNRALGDRVANHLMANAGRLAVKYLIWLQRINQGSGWKAMEDRGSPTANHFDHVHASFFGAGIGGRAGAVFATGGAAATGGFDPMAIIRPAFDAVMGPINEMIGKFGDNPFVQGLVSAVKKGIENLIAKGAELLGMGGGGGGGAGAEQWRGIVLQALGIVGQPASLADTVLRRLNQESGGNARAINNWDINAKKGTPSKGLMQVIDPTFAANRLPSLSADIYDPLANIVASMRYAMRRYGSLSAAYNRKGGYFLGGMVNETGLANLHRGEFVLNARLVDAIKGSSTKGGNTYNLTVINAGNSEIDLREQFRRMELLEA